MKRPYVRRDTVTGTLHVRVRGEWEGPFATEREALARRDGLRAAGVSAMPDPEPVTRIGIAAPNTDLVAGSRDTRTAVSPSRPHGSVPACPVCGWQPGGMGRYVFMRPHKQRRMTRDGVRVTDVPCPGSGRLPEYVIPLRTERTTR
jgi:hypothetical protein